MIVDRYNPYVLKESEVISKPLERECHNCEFFQEDMIGFCEECYFNDNFKPKENKVNVYKILEMLDMNLKVQLIDNEGKKLYFKNASYCLEICKSEILFKKVLMIGFTHRTCIIDIY